MLVANQKRRRGRRIIVSSAAGRYQYVYKTLSENIKELRISKNTRFSPYIQDRIGMYDIEKCGGHLWLTGKISTTEFANRLATVWASIPHSNGRSYYGQKVGIKRSVLIAKLNRIKRRHGYRR